MDQSLIASFRPLRQAVRRFVTDEVLPLEQERGLTWDVAPPRELRRDVRTRSKALGLYAPDMAEEVGGAGLSFLGRCEMEMELHSLATVFFQDVLGGGCGPSAILLHATPSQRERFLGPLMAGLTSTCFALSEPDAGSDATALQTRAVADDAGFVLNGTKNIVSNGPQADFAIVFAATKGAGAGGVTAFLVDAANPGYSVGRAHTCMGFTGFQGEIVLSDCRVTADDVLGPVGRGFALAMDWINGNRLLTAAMATGIGRGVIERSARYALGRTQFGAPIASYQTIQLKLADLATSLFAAELMVQRSAWMKDEGLDIRKESAMTKLYCSEMVNRAAYEAIQIHGGVGCLQETGIERVYRMVRILTILEGTSEMQRLTIAERMLKELGR